MTWLIPPLLFAITIPAMVAVHYWYPILQLVPPPYHWGGAALFPVGLVLAAWHKRLFQNIDTEINTFKQPNKLVTQGLFRVSRNPMYLGFTLALIGAWIYLGSLSSALFVLMFFLAAHCWYIPFEERAMDKQFGEAYRQYRQRVRRWL